MTRRLSLLHTDLPLESLSKRWPPGVLEHRRRPAPPIRPDGPEIARIEARKPGRDWLLDRESLLAYRAQMASMGDQRVRVADGRRELPAPVVGQLVLVDAGHLDVDVDAVEEGAGNPFLVSDYLTAPNRSRITGRATVGKDLRYTTSYKSACERRLAWADRPVGCVRWLDGIGL